MTTTEKIIAIINEKKTRSAWAQGVKVYALELLEDLEIALEYAPEALDNERLLEKALLNGANNWSHFSWSGCSLIYDNQIAKRLCNATEYKQTDGGNKNPNSREQWLDVQARALYQAADLIREAYRKANQ